VEAPFGFPSGRACVWRDRWNESSVTKEMAEPSEVESATDRGRKGNPRSSQRAVRNGVGTADVRDT
jgi:hypothetical protein